MATMVCMPAVSANANDAVLAEWTVKEGDTVRGGDTLGGIETDKAMVDLEAERDGVVGRLLVEAGTRVAVGEPLAVLLDQGETQADIAALLGDLKALPVGAGSAAEDAEDTEAAGEKEAAGEREVARDAEDGRDVDAPRIFASPVARRMAADAGLAIASLAGSGPAGRIVKRDVGQALAAQARTSSGDGMAGADAGRRYVPAAGRAPDEGARHADVHAAAERNAEAAPGVQRPQGSSAFDVLPHTPMRLTIARRLTESKATIPHFYLRGQCRADALLSARAQLNSVLPVKVSVNDLVVRGVACALRDVPDMNVSWTPDAMRRYRHADIAVAVATDDGLYTPILRAAEQLGVPAISAAMADLIARARGGRLAPVDYEGGSFGVSNLGTHGVADFAAIINPPQAAMLAVGAIAREAVADGDAVRAASVMRYTLAVDHRAIDGALAARWLARFTWYMEQPVAMLV